MTTAKNKRSSAASAGKNSGRPGHRCLDNIKKVEEALRQCRENFSLVAENSIDIIWMMDLDLHYTYISPSVFNLRGWTIKEAMRQTLDEVVAPSSLNAIRQVFAEELARERISGPSSTVRIMEAELFRKDGSTLWVEIRMTFLRDGKGQPTGIMGVSRDITEHRRTQEDLKLRNALLSTEQDVSPDGILVVDENAMILSYNRRFVDMWEIPADVIAEKADEKTLACVTGKVAEAERFLGKVRYLYEHRREESRDEIVLKDGRVFDRFSAPMYGPDERYYGRVWFFHDVTAARRAEEDVRRANEQLSAMVKQLEEHVRKDRLLGEMQEFLQGCSKTDEISSVIARAMTRLFPNSDGALFLLSPSKTDLETCVRWGGFPEDIEDNVFAPDACWGLRRGGNYVIEDAANAIVCPHLKHVPKGAYACLPLTAKGEVHGLLHLRSREEGISDGGKRMLEVLSGVATTLCEMLSLSISNIRLREKLSLQSIRDPLTGLFNRRYMEEYFEGEIRRAGRKNDKTGVIMVDIDHFKSFNDLHGHPAGDAVLAKLGEFLKSQMRGGDTVCRYGGEEFTIILPECALEDAGKRAAYLVEEVKKLRVQHHNQLLGPVTLSMGVAAFPQHGGKTEDLLRAADAALYRAKQEGRDRVVLAS